MANLSNFSLEGKNAWITGASYGIGFNIAKAFVAAGANMIIFNDINEAALQRGLGSVLNSSRSSTSTSLHHISALQQYCQR